MQLPAITNLRLHHIGLVVRAIEDARPFYVNVLLYRERTPVIHDPIQTAFVQFFSIPNSDHYLELVAPDGGTSKLREASRKGQPLHHLCYSCADIQHVVALLTDSGCFLIQSPVPAVAFDGRLIAWVMTPDGLLTELVERGPEGSL